MNLVEVFYTQIIPFGLWLAMLGMGLSLTMQDLRNIFAAPKALSVGLAGQMLLLPLLGFVLALMFAPTPEIAVGVMILAASPGGVTSNAYSFATRADVALSISITTVNSFLTVLSLPLITYMAVNYFLAADTAPELPVVEMIVTLFNLTVLPVAIGMGIRKFWSDKVARIIEPLRTATFVFLILLVVAGTIVSLDVLRQYFLQAALLAVSLNVCAMALGYGLSRGFRLNVPQSVAIVFEIGIQNISLASLVSLSLLGSREYFVITLIYAVIMKISALSFMYVAKRWLHTDREAARQVLASPLQTAQPGKS